MLGGAGVNTVSSERNLSPQDGKLGTDISELQVLPNEQKDQPIKFSICLFGFNGRKAISP